MKLKINLLLHRHHNDMSPNESLSGEIELPPELMERLMGIGHPNCSRHSDVCEKIQRLEAKNAKGVQRA